MSRTWLLASRTKWRGLELKAYRLWRSRVKRLRPSDPRRQAAYRQWQHCHAERVHRDKQLAAQTITTVSDKLVTFVKQREGGRGADGLFHPYWDADGRVWTQGYGHTENVGPHDKPWTEAEATQMLRHDLNGSYARGVLAGIKRFGLTNVKQWEFDALVDAVYNLGVGAVQGAAGFETLTRALTSGARNQIAKALLIYDHSGGRALPGLTARRRAEALMLEHAVYQEA